MRRFVLMMAVAVTVSSALCGKVYAEAYVHDGLFLRMAPGIGWNGTSESVAGSSLKMSGASGLFNFAIGGAVAQDLVLHLDVSVVSTSDPKVTVNGNSMTSNVTSMSTSLVGLGVTYYLPSNYYITGAFGVSETSGKSNGTSFSTDNGLGVNLMVGKEWWVSDNWGIGVAGQFLYTNSPDKAVGGVKPDVKSTTVGLLFSATYN